MFKIGQKVVCKDLSRTNGGGYPYGIEKGKIYEVESIDNCSAGHGICLVGVTSHSLKSCACGKKHPRNSFMAWRFEPVKYEIVSNMEIIKEIITERSDVPVKEPVF